MTTAGQNFGLSILKQVMDSLGDEWDILSDEHKKNVAEVSMDYGALLIMATYGDHDVAEEMQEVRAAVSCWEFVAEDVVRRAMVDAASKGLELAAEAALGAVLP